MRAIQRGCRFAYSCVKELPLLRGWLPRFTAGGRGGEAVLPEAAMSLLLEGSGTEFDPLVVKAFVNLMGLYPVGCMVMLDSGEIATVVVPARDEKNLDRPKVRLVSNGSGAPMDQVVDLLERDLSGGYQRSILKLYQQQEVDLDLEEYLWE